MAAFTKYNKFLLTQVNGGNYNATGFGVNSPNRVVNFSSDNIMIMLVSDQYTLDAADHTVYSDVESYEVTGTNYTKYGEPLANPSVTETSGEVFFNGDTVTWLQDPNGFDDARYAILYKKASTDNTSTLIACVDLGGNKSNQGDDYSIQFDNAGLIKWS